MTTEKGPEFYTGQGYLKNSNVLKVYSKLYNAIADLLPEPSLCPKIIDLGCGVGYFAEILHLKGYEKYTGIDFSKHMINHATKRAPYYNFLQGNLYDKKIKKLFSQYTLFTILETLEHVNKDLDILSSIPAGATIIGSVPNRFCAGHVRIFFQTSDVINRYDKIIDFDLLREMNLNPKKKTSKVIIFRGERKEKKR